MDNLNPLLDRRGFLMTAVGSAAIAGAAGAGAMKKVLGAKRTMRGPDNQPRIVSLELLTSAPLPKMRDFYHTSLGLPVLAEQADRLTIGAGASRLTFVRADNGHDKPFYHFAFNIPENKIVSARGWQLRRTPLISIPERLRDARYPDDVVNYSHWNAHSIFFLDPGGNVVEYIARHDLKNAEKGEFASSDILYVSEIGLIVDDVPGVAAKLHESFGVSPYRGESEMFTAMGDELGLLLVMKLGRILNFHPEDTSKAARVYRTVASIRGAAHKKHLVNGFPYEVTT